MRVLVFGVALVLPGFVLAAVPSIQDVTDSAAYGPRVAPGSLATIFGTAMASSTASATAFPLPTNLAGTTVSVGGTLAPLLYVSAGQINFQVPSSTKAGDINVVVNGPGGASAAFAVTVTAEAPAIYQYGTNRALAQNANGALNGASAPAASGTYITVYVTGLGAVTNPVTDGTAVPVSPLSAASATATATIGPATAPIQFLGLAPDFAGLGQANIQVPSLPSGDYPLTITIGGYVSASAVVSVSGSGTAYTSPLSLVSSVAFDNSNPSSLALYSGIAYVCGEDRIVMVNVNDPASPVLIGEFGDNVLAGNGDRCVINTQGTTPYLVEIVGATTATGTPDATDSFAVYSLANPSSPALLTVVSNAYGHMENLSFSGNYGIVTTSFLTYFTANHQVASQEGDFLVYDFTNPAAPVFVTRLTQNRNLAPWSEVVGLTYAYVAGSSASGTSTTGTGTLNVVSIASPYSPTSVSQVTVGNADILLSFDISGNTLLAAGNTSGQRNPGTPDFDFTGNLTLTTMSLVNPAAPQVISSIATSLQVNGTFTTAAFGNGVFAIVNEPPDTDDFGPASLMIVDARTPSNILAYPYQTQVGFSGLVTTSNGYLLAPTALGLNIYSLQL
jgi:uncharacterized protein (TIGR03437 family)